MKNYIKVPCKKCDEDIVIEGQAEELPFGPTAKTVRFTVGPSKSSLCKNCGAKIIFQSAITLDGKFVAEFIFAE